jgi:Na+-transporting methylmalonyl-CoA/oxaloacetate decarboxylase gamma subunit
MTNYERNKQMEPFDKMNPLNKNADTNDKFLTAANRNAAITLLMATLLLIVAGFMLHVAAGVFCLVLVLYLLAYAFHTLGQGRKEDEYVPVHRKVLEKLQQAECALAIERTAVRDACSKYVPNLATLPMPELLHGAFNECALQARGSHAKAVKQSLRDDYPKELAGYVAEQLSIRDLVHIAMTKAYDTAREPSPLPNELHRIEQATLRTSAVPLDMPSLDHDVPIVTRYEAMLEQIRQHCKPFVPNTDWCVTDLVHVALRNAQKRATDKAHAGIKDTLQQLYPEHLVNSSAVEAIPVSDVVFHIVSHERKAVEQGTEEALRVRTLCSEYVKEEEAGVPLEDVVRRVIDYVKRYTQETYSEHLITHLNTAHNLGITDVRKHTLPAVVSMAVESAVQQERNREAAQHKPQGD